VVELGGDQAAAMAGLAKISRDNARTPMQWDAGPNGGFTTGAPWLPVNPNHTWLNAESQVSAADSVFAHYQALIRLRHELPILRDGVFIPLMEDDPQIWAYTRTSPTAELVVLVNCGRDARAVDVSPQWVGARLLLANLPGTPATITSTSLDLAAWDARMYVVDHGPGDDVGEAALEDAHPT
jgi:oligo-1,6-glucosidase